MLLYIIRHGEPNYETDTLTELGKLQAEAVENLFELAEKEGDLTKISSLQKELFDIRLELAEAESSLLVYDNSISYSTVTIRVSETKEYIPEPVEERGFFGKIYDCLKKNIGYIFDDIESFTIWFITNIPYFIINAILITIAVFVFIKLRKLYKKIKNKKNNQDEESKETADENNGEDQASESESESDATDENNIG